MQHDAAVLYFAWFSGLKSLSICEMPNKSVFKAGCKALSPLVITRHKSRIKNTAVSLSGHGHATLRY